MTPLPVARLPVQGLPGVLLLHPCPGIAGRRLDEDLALLRKLGAEAMLTLLPGGELTLLQLGRDALEQACSTHGLDWRQAAIDDMDVPDRAFVEGWSAIGKWVERHLARGAAVSIHCRAGLGRTGMVAARFLVEQGVAADEAIAAIRSVRPGSIETAAQEAWIALAAL